MYSEGKGSQPHTTTSTSAIARPRFQAPEGREGTCVGRTGGFQQPSPTSTLRVLCIPKLGRLMAIERV